MKKFIKTNLIDENQLDETSIKELKKHYKKSKTKLIFKNGLFLFLIIFLISIFFLSHLAATSNSKLAKTVQKNPFIKQISQLISADTKKLQGEEDGRTNILIMGMGGEGHDGPLLTDTIIILSYDYNTKQTSMVSIPRDLVVKINDGTYKKINHLYTIGESIKKGYGMEYEKEMIEKNIGIPLHYAVTIDFAGFKEIVDALGGVDITIENSFIDYTYPTYNHKVQTVKFTKGEEHMDGERALQFSRSRHGFTTDGNGIEGNDFARSKRQFKVIDAIKDKVLSFSTLTNPSKVTKLFKILNNYIKTDIESWEALRFVDILKTMEKDKIFTKTISDAPDSILQSTISTYDGAFILMPRNNNYNLLENFFKNIFGVAQEEKAQEESAIIEVFNGTQISGLASKKANELKKLGLEIRKIENAINRNTETTIIYDLSKNKKPETLKKIQEIILGARSSIIPEEEKSLVEEDVDFVIILGKDQE